ncbi:nucleotidyltransferase [Rhizobium leguminosarum]|uniref:nucleotidyltransferase n=1 Tax=Rhizobium leguminosarum TaxID=384 RepID=UPI0010325D65|nr:nucleotidyltransferase [Rhizobium leguminosarum]TBC94723.1 nucleotidyltransferase [Rhizobium leguminosarum]
MSDAYLRQILVRLRADTGPSSPARSVQAILTAPLLRWAGQYLVSMEPSGSFAKGTAIHGGTDIDIFASLSSEVTHSLAVIYNTLFNRLRDEGFNPRQQNVSIGIKVGAYSVDVVPARRQAYTGEFHSLYRRKAETWTQTNVVTHINAVRNSGRAEEIMIMKAWREQKGLVFPSFYLELVTIEACRGRRIGDLAENVWAALAYVRDNIMGAVFIDPANTNNRISDDLTVAEKRALANAASTARQATNWSQIVI